MEWLDFETGWLESTGVESLYAQLHRQIDQIESTANLHHPSLRERIRFENRRITERLLRLEQDSISPFTPKYVGTTSLDVSPEARKLPPCCYPCSPDLFCR